MYGCRSQEFFDPGQNRKEHLDEFSDLGPKAGSQAYYNGQIAELTGMEKNLVTTQPVVLRRSFLSPGFTRGLRLDISRRLSRVRRDALLTRQAVPGDGLLIVKAIGVTKENAVWIIFVAEVRQCFQFSGRKAFFGHSGPYALTT
jgi:hypothetical protein